MEWGGGGGGKPWKKGVGVSLAEKELSVYNKRISSIQCKHLPVHTQKGLVVYTDQYEIKKVLPHQAFPSNYPKGFLKVTSNMLLEAFWFTRHCHFTRSKNQHVNCWLIQLRCYLVCLSEYTSVTPVHEHKWCTGNISGNLPKVPCSHTHKSNKMFNNITISSAQPQYRNNKCALTGLIYKTDSLSGTTYLWKSLYSLLCAPETMNDIYKQEEKWQTGFVRYVHTCTFKQALHLFSPNYTAFSWFWFLIQFWIYMI